MFKLGVTITGTKELKINLKLVQKHYRKEFAKALHAEAKKIEAESNRRIPVDTGFAKANSYVVPPSRMSKKPVAEVGYLDDVYYIVPLHEIPAHHAVGEVKFLENAINYLRPSILKNINNFIKAKEKELSRKLV